jgi:hypothetical protein
MFTKYKKETNLKLAIIGSRSFTDYSSFKKRIQYINIGEIVSGGANGADSLAEQYAKENNIPIKIFKPNWEKFGKSAGYIRNKQIIDYADQVVAFWDYQSKGTKHSIDISRKQNKLKHIFKI